VGWCSSIAITKVAYIVVEGDLLQKFLTVYRGCRFSMLLLSCKGNTRAYLAKKEHGSHSH
jgi:hypothetical protein